MKDRNDERRMIERNRFKEKKKKESVSWMWWQTPFIPALEGQRQVNLWIWDQSVLHSEFQASQGYVARPCLQTTTKAEAEWGVAHLSSQHWE